ncbi:MAG: acetyltransferase [Chloroflexi bacterium]|nr:acetyltransferase [Chloroflexota bacterium]
MIHPSAEISPSARIGPNTRIWAYAQVCDDACIGSECIVGRGVYIDRGVTVGSRVKIQTGAHLYRGTVIEDGVFIGPLVCFTNDKHPRAVNGDGSLKMDADWELGKTVVQHAASLGAGSIVLPNITIGRFAMVAAGSVVVHSVPDHGLVVGAPAKLEGYVCKCGNRLRQGETWGGLWRCFACQAVYSKLDSGRLEEL